ncbi:hypothetical protein ACJMK2_001600 [Sinanodonta woodiana]|uniref:SGNH hydrolase-type esterase domain-containing protein n=1 Tax=Sinanodonta woodiana TaxID=1069815 RepID=A0ABD3XW74_SINWO
MKGVGGRTIDKLMFHDMHEVNAKRPDIAILMIGDNDVNADTSPEPGVGQAVKRVQSTSSRSTSKQQKQQQTYHRPDNPTVGTTNYTDHRTTRQKLDHILGFLQGTTPGHQPATSSLEQEQGPTATTSALTDHIVQQSVGTSVA